MNWWMHSRRDVAGPYGWLSDQPASLGKSKKRVKCRTCTVSCTSYYCDREEEINAFIPEEYWSLDADLRSKGEKAIDSKVLWNRKEKMTIHRKRWMRSWKKLKMQRI